MLSIPELLVLAAALDIPPALLLYPLHAGGDVAPLPNFRTHPWDAYKTLIGELVLVHDDPSADDGDGNGEVAVGPGVSLRRSTEPIILVYRHHDHAVREYLRWHESDPDKAESLLMLLASMIREAADKGWVLPPRPSQVDEALKGVSPWPGDLP